MHIKEFLDKIDIIDLISGYVNLREYSNDTAKGLCPFHSEKTPSFSVTRNIDRTGDYSIGGFHCFGCGISGNAITFIKKYFNLSYEESLEVLAKKYNIPIDNIDNKNFSDNQLDALNNTNKNIILKPEYNYIPDLSLLDFAFADFGFIKEYLNDRCIKDKIANEYNLKAIFGLNRIGVYIPVYLEDNNNFKIVEVQIRFIDTILNEPKIKGVSGSRKISFFGLYQLDNNLKNLLITESWGNTLSYVSKTNNKNIIATMGSHFTSGGILNQINTLKVELLKYRSLKKIIIIPDVKLYDSWVNEAKKLGLSLDKNVYIFNIRQMLKDKNYKDYNDNIDTDLNDILKIYKDIDIEKEIEKYSVLVWNSKKDYFLNKKLSLLY